MKYSKECLIEYLRPWKLITLLVGIALLIAGSYYYPAPDWDIPISLIMASLTYLTAPWSIRVLYMRKWRLLPLIIFMIWFSVDGSYAIYWHFRDPAALEAMRAANFPASLSLYLLCGMVWLYRGSVEQMVAEIKGQLVLTQKRK